MVPSSTALFTSATLFISQSLAVAIPSGQLVARGGLPSSNPPDTVCYNSWETITNDPVVQYWYVTAPNAGNSIKADRMWNHLNLNGCAPTETKYYAQPDINGSSLTFHTSEACTAARVSHAIRSSSDPPINIACQFSGKEEPAPSLIGNSLAAGGANAIVNGVVAGILSLGGV